MFNRKGSVFDNSVNGIWINVGEITLEKRSNKNVIFSYDFLRDLLDVYQDNGIYKDGIVIYKGSKINIIAVRVLEESDEKGKYSNKFKFYANSTVLSKYSLLDLCNFINYLTPGGKYIPNAVEMNGTQKSLVFSTPIGMNLNCMIYSEEKYPESQDKNKVVNKIEDKEYLFSYRNVEHKKFSKIAEDIFHITNCSRKGIPLEVLRRNEQEAYILHSKNIGTEGLIGKIPDVEIEY